VAQMAGTGQDLLEMKPLTPNFGGLISGVDLSEPISKAVQDLVQDAFADRSLIVIQGQNLTPDQQIDFSKQFGPLECHVLADFCLDGYPEIFVVSNILQDGRHVGAYGGSKKFHADLAYMEEPSLGSLFYCKERPQGEGDTAFISMTAVYASLPDDKKKWLEDKNLIFDFVWHHEQNHQHRPPMSPAQKAKTPPVVHPAVRTHPKTGRRSLFVSEFHCRRFEGMSEEESRPIIDELIAFAKQPEFGYAHRWTPGDLVIWDNRCLLHKAMPYDEENTRRLMHRTTVKGDKPFLAPI
jgi:taurine dioxygenase